MDFQRIHSSANATSVEAKNFTGLPGGNSEREPPDPIPNSEVKTFCADGSVACCHARVGHCQAPHARKAPTLARAPGLFLMRRCRAVARLKLSGNVRQPNHVLANEIAGDKAQRRPGAGEEWLAATKHHGAEVESILINKTKVGQASYQVWSGNINLPNELSLQPTYRRLDAILNERGVGAD